MSFTRRPELPGVPWSKVKPMRFEQGLKLEKNSLGKETLTAILRQNKASSATAKGVFEALTWNRTDLKDFPSGSR